MVILIEGNIQPWLNRHPGEKNAFANFVDINEAFVEIIKDLESRAMQSGSEDPAVAAVLAACEENVPGEVDIKGNGLSIKIQHHKLWKKVMKDRFAEAVVGKQRRGSISPLKQQIEKGRKGMKFVVRFK